MRRGLRQLNHYDRDGAAADLQVKILVEQPVPKSAPVSHYAAACGRGPDCGSGVPAHTK